jgi:hypothetical protein
MAIDDLYFGVMCSAMDTARRKLPDPTAVMRVGCLSYPDVLVTREQISERYPHLATASYRLRDDAEKIRKWHSMPHLSEIIETSDLFDKLGCETDFFDFAEIRGGEIIADLNMPLGVNHHGKYDVVIDTGTLEHCFNVGTAFENMCRMARIGGFIVSAAPMSKVNHGFWNFSPCAYDNYFRQNRFDSIFLGAFYKDKAGLKQIEISPNKRQLAPSEAVLMAIARRTEHSTFNLPIQQKYL